MAAFRDHLRLGAPTDDEMRHGVDRLLRDPETEFLLAEPEAGAPPAGVAQLRFRYGVWRAGGDCLLEDLYVDAAARGAGLGQALVAAALDRARARGCRRVELDVNESNEAAQRLYGRFGFSATSNSYGARDLYMRLHIDEIV
jgi:ribosomal protein S18 acetylase RimI-like enzyme